MNKLLCILFVTSMLLLGGCGYKSNNVADKDEKSIQRHDTNKKIDEKEIEELILSWFQNNHAMYKATNQYICECWITDTLYGKKAIALMKKKFDKKKARKMAYCDAIERDGVKYFAYGEFESSELQLVYLLDINTGEIYNWDLPEDVLNKYTNS